MHVAMCMRIHHTRLGLLRLQTGVLGADAVLCMLTARAVRAGQSVIAFATGAYSPQPYVMKFYAVRAAFDAERALRSNRAIAQLAPRIQSVHDPLLPPDQNAAICDGAGRPLAPCIVTAHQDTLVEWRQRATPDIFQAVPVRSAPQLSTPARRRLTSPPPAHRNRAARCRCHTHRSLKCTAAPLHAGQSAQHTTELSSRPSAVCGPSPRHGRVIASFWSAHAWAAVAALVSVGDVCQSAAWTFG